MPYRGRRTKKFIANHTQCCPYVEARLSFVCVWKPIQALLYKLCNYFRNVINQHLDSSDKTQFCVCRTVYWLQVCNTLRRREKPGSVNLYHRYKLTTRDVVDSVDKWYILIASLFNMACVHTDVNKLNSSYKVFNFFVKFFFEFGFWVSKYIKRKLERIMITKQFSRQAYFFLKFFSHTSAITCVVYINVNMFAYIGVQTY